MQLILKIKNKLKQNKKTAPTAIGTEKLEKQLSPSKNFKEFFYTQL